jgi:hypothetical protein
MKGRGSRVRFLNRAVPLTLSLFLAGCSIGPTEQEIQKALQGEIDSVNELAGIMMGDQNGVKPLEIEVVSVNKWGCRAAEDQSYICDVELDLNSAKAGPHKQKQSVRMAKGDTGWIVIKAL